MTPPPAPREGLKAAAVLSLPIALFLLAPLAALLAALRPGSLFSHAASPGVLKALGVTLWTTAAATALCVTLGLPAAYLLARGSFRGKALLDALLDLPATVPPVVAGVALLLTFGRRGWLGSSFELLGVRIGFTAAAVVMAQVFIAAPFFIKAARAGIEAVDPALEDAARTLGAGPWRVFWSVTAPLAAPSLSAGAVMAWARALSEFGATMMFAGNFPGRTQTLSLAVMTAMETDLDTAVAVSAISLALALLSLGAARLLARRAAGLTTA